jgi:hypothetical protein
MGDSACAEIKALWQEAAQLNERNLSECTTTTNQPTNLYGLSIILNDHAMGMKLQENESVVTNIDCMSLTGNSVCTAKHIRVDRFHSKNHKNCSCSSDFLKELN